MPKYVIKGSAGFAGTDFVELIEARNEEEAFTIGQTITEEWLCSYGVELVDNDTADEDIERMDEDGIQYVYETDFCVELYDPEVHDVLM